MSQVTNRKIERQGAKIAYKKFCKTWNAEKRLQEKLLAEGKELPKGQQKLGRKPPFSYWLSMTKKMYEAQRKAAAQQANRIDDLQFTGADDLSWDEEEVAAGQGDPKVDPEDPVQVELLDEAVQAEG